MRGIYSLVLVLIAIPSWAQTPTPDPANVQRISEFIAKSEGHYTTVANGIWETAYKGKNSSIVNVRIMTAEDGVFFFVTLFEREKLVLSRNLLLKIAEMNSDYDYAKLCLDDDSLDVRLDARVRALDLQGFKDLENQAAVVADEAYGILRDFLP